MKEITLHSKKYPGLVALVDDEDYELVSQYRWRPHKMRNTFYAQTDLYRGSRGQKTTYMHILITGFKMTDHEDRNGLNCQRYNMRDATNAQNGANQGKQRRATSSRFKGVSWDTHSRKWQVNISSHGRKVTLGRFTDEVKAALIYDCAALELFGEFAATNAKLGLLPIEQAALAACA